MRIDDREISANVEDRRGRRMGSGLPMRGGAGAIILVLGVMIAGYYGIDLTPLLSGGGMAPSAVQQDEPYTASPEEERWASFTGRVLKTTEDVWSAVFREMGRTYSPPKLVLYTGTTETGCGFGDAATGPFYCPADQTVYLDLSFFREMESRLGGGGDFAYAYVLAHEVGHHVQHLLGTGDRVRRLQEGASQVEGNRLSVRLELQADAYAGVWGHYMQKEGVLDAGDLEEALKTAEAIGDDRLQRQSGRAIVPDSFTHGTSEQRYYWFKRGFDSGDINQCDTFADPK